MPRTRTASPPPRVDPERALRIALRLARAAGRAALKHFCKAGLRIERKPDDSPVSAADKAADAVLRRGLRRAFPGHAVVSEESPPDRGDGRHVWILDPVDGTLQFIRGLPHWSVLAALEIDGEVEVGVMDFPALRSTLWARRGGGAFENGKPVRVSGRTWDEAWVLHGQAGRFFRSRAARALRALSDSAWVCSGGFQVPIWAALARGQIEGFCEIGAEVWDRAAPSVIIEEAGGVFTNLQGRRTHRGPGAIVATPGVHRRMLLALRGGSKRP